MTFFRVGISCCSCMRYVFFLRYVLLRFLCISFRSWQYFKVLGVVTPSCAIRWWWIISLEREVTSRTRNAV